MAKKKKSDGEASGASSAASPSSQGLLVRDRVVELRRVRASDLVPNPKNYAVHSDAQKAALRGAIGELGFAGAELVRETADGRLMLIDGHARREVVGDGVIPVLVLDVTEEEADKLLATLDPIAAMAERDSAKLQALLADIQVDDSGLQALIDDMLSECNEALADKPDDVPDAVVLTEDPVTKRNDIWLLGEHRLMCGDSTNANDVARLMNGRKADVTITDPPYSVKYNESHKTRGGNESHISYVEADDDPSQLLSFMQHVSSDVMVWSYPIDRHFQKLAAAYDKFGWVFKKELVWVKDTFSFWIGAKYQQRHEPIMVAVRKGAALHGNVPSNATTVFEYPRPKSHELHPTAKPVGLWQELIQYHSKEGDVIFEPFCGSGTTLVVAETLNRRCYGMEISPSYCDAIVKRWEQQTNKRALIETRNTQT